MILVPVKDLTRAKQRLSPVLSPEQRLALAQAMCEDVLRELAYWKGRPAVAVVTNDSFAGNLAARLDFEVIADDNSGETSAIEMATAVCVARGAESTLVVPADIPLIDRAELQKIAESAPLGGSVLVPDAAGRGTNAAWRAPGDLFPLRFGNDSFLPHLAAARTTGKACIVLELAGIARDIDRPEDLRQLVAASGKRQSQKLARSWRLPEVSGGATPGKYQAGGAESRWTWAGTGDDARGESDQEL
jgi:2-phospho-L-lactate guanylyltransferase